MLLSHLEELFLGQNVAEREVLFGEDGTEELEDRVGRFEVLV